MQLQQPIYHSYQQDIGRSENMWKDGDSVGGVARVFSLVFVEYFVVEDKTGEITIVTGKVQRSVRR